LSVYYNNTIDVITGGSTPYSAIDWFPLNRYIPIMIGGVLIGHVLGDKLNFNIGSSKILEFIGNNSLELYTSHVLFLIGLNRFI
jgi:peptidoglycan/LPS O-acetylase OafA/YrhL